MHGRFASAALLLLATGCGGLPEDALVIDEIQVSGVRRDQLFADRLEVEVHLYGATSAGPVFLGCAGADTGLDPVDEPNLTYTPRAHFVGPGGEEIIDVGALPGRVFFAVTEDDSDACPSEQSATGPSLSGPSMVEGSAQDDLAGLSPIIDRTDLSAGTTLDFDGAVLRLAPAGLAARAR